MTYTKVVRDNYPDLPAKDRELFRAVISLATLLLKSAQEQKITPNEPNIGKEKGK